MICSPCLKKIENIHKFAKMAAEMQEKFHLLLAAKQEKPKPKIKIKSLDDINKEAVKDKEKKFTKQDPKEIEKHKIKAEVLENFEMNLDVAIEVVGDNSNNELKLDEVPSESIECAGLSIKLMEKKNLPNGYSKSKRQRKSSMEEENEADTSDSDRLVIQEEKPNPSLLQCLLLKVPL